MSIVGDDVEQAGQGVQRKFLDRGPVAESAVAFQVQGQGHRIQARVLHAKSEVAFVARVESLHVMADVMADDDAVAQVFQELLEGRGLVESVAALLARDAVDRHGAGVVLHF